MGTRTDEIKQALVDGEALTRVDACERFGITGSTFRWVIKSMREAGVSLEFAEVPGRRGTVQREWRVTTDPLAVRGGAARSALRAVAHG